MKHKWSTVPLDDVLCERKEKPSQDDLDSGRVKVVSKISFETGQIQIRPDSETRTGMISIHPGDLVVSGINAAKGAIAIYSNSNTEPIAATIHYAAYIPNHRVDIQFLWWLLRSRFFRGLLADYLPGGIKTELKPKRLLPISVPLPSLAEQRRIVARIEKLAVQVQEARVLRQQAEDEAEALHLSTLHKHFVTEASAWTPMAMENAIEISDKQVDPTRPEYSQLPHISGENMEKKRVASCLGAPLKPTE